MPRRENHLGAARKHGRRAIAQMRHMTADSALFWVLSHRSRVAGFRRALKGTAVAKPFEQLLRAIRQEATALPRPAPRRKAARARRARRIPASQFLAPPFLIG